MCQILSCCSFFHRVYRLHRIIISLDIIKSFDFNRKLTSTSAVISHPLVKTGPCSTWTRNLKVIRSTPIGSIRTFSSEPRVSMTDIKPLSHVFTSLKILHHISTFDGPCISARRPSPAFLRTNTPT